MDSPTCPHSMITALSHFPSSPTSSTPRSSGAFGDRDERPHKCPKPGCFQRFKRRFTLKEHIKTHTGEKPFVCPVKSCSKTFTTSGNLARHKRLHPWLKPQVCLVDGCDRSFSNEMKLELHMKTHFKGPRVVQTCPIAHCGKQFSTMGNLTRHLKQQHGEHTDDLCDVSGSERADSPRTVDSEFTAPAFGCGRMYQDASRAFNPLMHEEVSDVSDEELLATLQCLF